RTSGLRIMLRDLSRAVCVVSSSQSSALETRFQPFFQASWLPSEGTATATFHAHKAALFLKPSGAAATRARKRATPRAGSTPAPSTQRPSQVSTAATSWLSPSCGSAGAVATARVGWHGASRNYHRHDTTPTAGVSRPRVYTRCSPVAPPRRPADGYQDCGARQRPYGSAHRTPHAPVRQLQESETGPNPTLTLLANSQKCLAGAIWEHNRAPWRLNRG